MTVDFLAVRRAIAEDMRRAFSHFRSQHADQFCYGYAIMTDDDAGSVCPVATTEQQRQVRLNTYNTRRSSENKPANPEELAIIRWSPHEWPYLDYDGTRLANDLLNAESRYDPGDPGGFFWFAAEAYAAMVLGMKDLADSGFFSNDGERARVFLVCTMGDSDCGVWLEDVSARTLNSKAVYESFFQQRTSLRQDYARHLEDPSELYRAFVVALASRTIRPDQPVRPQTWGKWLTQRVHGVLSKLRRLLLPAARTAPRDDGEMNATAWLAVDSPSRMFDFLERKISPRKLRLFGIACCRRIEELMTDAGCLAAVDLAERFVEGQVSAAEMGSLRVLLERAYLAHNEQIDARDNAAQVKLWCIGAAKNLLQDDTDYRQEPANPTGDADLLCIWQAASSAAAHFNVKRVGDHPPETLFAEHRAQANLLREILGNPFEAVSLDPSWRAARVVQLAETIYDERSFEQMPRLGQALKAAGCRCKEILDHCLSPGPHVRGCWLLDLLLDRH